MKIKVVVTLDVSPINKLENLDVRTARFFAEESVDNAMKFAGEHGFQHSSLQRITTEYVGSSSVED